MINRNLIKFCTAALAGSLLGIAYERSPPLAQWPSLIPSVTAHSSIVPKGRQPKEMDFEDSTFTTKLPVDQIDPVASAENLKHSARFGLPSKDNIRLFNDFLLSYDRRLRAPAWVIEHLSPEKLKHNADVHRNRSKFHVDTSLHPYFRAVDGDFKNSGFDRGHMAAAGNHKTNQLALDQTFAFSNISPQEPEFNRGGWEKLETYVRWRAKRAKNLWVVTGPLYLPMKARDGNLYVTYRVLGNNHVSVPTHYFKVFLVEEKDDRLVMEAFLMPNDNQLDGKIRLDEYRVPIGQLDIIERASGVIFFDQVSREKLEAPLALAAGFKEDHKSEHKTRRNQ